MAVTLADFRARFPEFNAASDSLVTAVIEEAERYVSPKVWSVAVRDDAVKYWAAHLIAINPSGEFARLDDSTSATLYSNHFDRLKRMVAAGFRVI